VSAASACGCWDDDKTEAVYSPGWSQWLSARCHEPWPEKLIVSESTIIRAATKPLPQRDDESTALASRPRAGRC
jgi:hypothetical protein